MKRRTFLTNLAGFTVLGLTPELIPVSAFAENRITPKNIIIRTSWSINDLGARIYLPAVFRMIQRNVPGAVIHFWPYLDDDVIFEKIKLNTTKFSLLHGDLDKPDESVELIEILKKANMVFHLGGTVSPSGSNLPESDLLNSRKLFEFCGENKIPYLLHSLKIADENHLSDELKTIINQATFVYSSYSAEKKSLESAGIKNKNYEFAPDADFYFELNEDISAGQYLRSVNLAGKQFLILSLRRYNMLGQDLELEKHITEFSDLIRTWKEQTGNPVLLMTGDSNDVEYIKKTFAGNNGQAEENPVIMLEDIDNPSIVLSIIDKARICVGNDPYTLMMAVGSKVPVLFTRTSESDRSNEIFINTGLDDQVFSFNNTQTEGLGPTVLSMNKNYVDELVDISKVSKFLTQSEKKSFKDIDKFLGVKVIENNRRPSSGGYQHHGGRPGSY